MKIIDSFLNSITMYRLTLYVLIAYVAAAVFFSILGLVHFRAIDILSSAGVTVATGYVSNKIFAKIFGAITNIESVFNTALILVLIVPVSSPLQLVYISVIIILAMAVKYFPTVDKRHIFNPAAAGVVALTLLSPEHAATWWVGTTAMAPIVLIGGLLIVRKIRREAMVAMFFGVVLTLVAITSLLHMGTVDGVLNAWKTSLLNSSLLFLAFIMLTEPLTSPSTKGLRVTYATLVGVLFVTPQIRLFGFILTPEQALLFGNVFTYIVNPWPRMSLALSKAHKLTSDTYAFLFPRPKGYKYNPGQYLEWSLPHPNTDNRGNRRYFSLASSPTEDELMVLVKFHIPPSSFKKQMLSMNQGDKIIANQTAGDFVIFKKLKDPLVLVAGGVGFAPFRSMIKYIVDKKIQTDIIVLFVNRNMEDIVFADLLKEAEEFGVHTIHILTNTKAAPVNWSGGVGRLNAEMIRKFVSDSDKRKFYISGPQLMVQATESLLLDMNIAHNKIETDYFPGY
jgi:ferredoxin-NADP reductase/Na+-translocating ferredoxin:NAD+ oxidoreductase RnfD subunit